MSLDAADTSARATQLCVRQCGLVFVRVSFFPAAALPLAVALVLAAIPLCAQTDLGRVLPQDHAVHLVAFGDFGSGNQHQLDIAKAIERRHQQERFDFGITMGDNFYRCGVRSVTDPVWTTRWENMYTPLGIKFYAALGNHDYGHPTGICPAYRSSPDAEVAYTKKSESWRMPARYYTYTAGPVRFFALDTEGWTAAEFEWIKSALEGAVNEPGIRWRVVYGHHPLLSSGHHATERRIAVLRQELGPLFKATKVDLYIGGHDHSLEHLSWNGIDLLVGGGGGAALRFDSHPKPESLFSLVKFGFLEVKIDERQITAQFYDAGGKPLDQHPLVRAQPPQ